MPSSDVLALGKRLVEELDLEDGRDTLGCWMAHHIAELVSAVETANPAGVSVRSAECRAAILDLWEHRNSLPSGKRPFEDIEPIVERLRSLNPEHVGPYYFQSIARAAKEGATDSGARDWLELASGFDHTARTLIGYCLSMAAQSAVERSKEWVALAERLNGEIDPDVQLIRIILKSASEISCEPAHEINDPVREVLQKRRDRLMEFINLSQRLVDHFDKQLAGLGPLSSTGDTRELGVPPVT